ncbi:MAG: redoxin domain-containing protein [Solirubrobacterales bacterium]|nr:redoxin domain-containing protein [Solirubrobacterales bacterium]
MTARQPSPKSLLAIVVVAMLIVGGVVLAGASAGGSSSSDAAASNPELDPGTPLHGVAPGFTLTDQFGHRVSLSSFRGRVVFLAFNDPLCTTICPLTTMAMVQAKALLGAAGSQVQLLGVGANPTKTEVKWVRAYSRVHEMTYQWHFLTAPLPALKHVWKEYGIEAQVVRGQIDHTPALYVIDTDGRLSRLYLTQMSYASVDQLAQELAVNASRLLPTHPRVHEVTSYTQVPLIDPGTPVSLPRAGGGSVRLGPSRTPRLYLFFDTWDSEVTDLAAHLGALDRYQHLAGREHLPGLTAVDEASVEPSRDALSRFLGSLSHPLSYPVAIDESGRVGDGYRVQDEPWLELISPTGEFLYYRDISTGGWLSLGALIARERYALAHAPRQTAVTGGSGRLKGSPAALAALHQQGGQLLGSGLSSRLRALRGYPIVINAWASWCPDCQQEFHLLAAASLRYGRQVAFLGADTDDSAGDARTFLAQHRVSYPSYQTTFPELSPLATFIGLPVTIFINRSGNVADVHTGPYLSLASLQNDIRSFALGG